MAFYAAVTTSRSLLQVHIYFVVHALSEINITLKRMFPNTFNAQNVS